MASRENTLSRNKKEFIAFWGGFSDTSENMAIKDEMTNKRQTEPENLPKPPYELVKSRDARYVWEIIFNF